MFLLSNVPPAGVHAAVLLGEVGDGEHGRGLRHSEHCSVPEGRGLAPQTFVARVTSPGVIAGITS